MLLKKDLKRAFAHDLKNKLFSVKLNLHLVLNKDLNENEKKDILKKISLTADETADMIKDFFESEEYRSIKFLKYTTFDLGKLIEEIVNEFKIDAKLQQNIAILFPPPKEPFLIKANRFWLKKALINIIHNSIKYNRNNGRVFINLYKEKNGYMISIKDTGIGVDTKESLFEKYSTSSKSGSGLGLYTAKSVIESHDGIIVCDSQKFKGCTFYIYLPKIPKKITYRIAVLFVIFVLSVILFFLLH